MAAFPCVIQYSKVKILNSGEVISGDKIGGYAMKILESGGIKPLFRTKLKD